MHARVVGCRQRTFSGAEKPKREEGENPSRTRRCDRVVSLLKPLSASGGREGAMNFLQPDVGGARKSEDLPDMEKCSPDFEA